MTFLHQHHHTLPDPWHPTSLSHALLGNYRAMFIWPLGSPPSTGWHLELLQGRPRAFSPTTPGDISFLWTLGDPTLHLHTRGLFQNMQRISLSVEWDIFITSLSISHLKLSWYTPFFALWPLMATARESDDKKSAAPEGMLEVRSDISDFTQATCGQARQSTVAHELIS